VAAILIGGIASLATSKQIPNRVQHFLKLLLGVWTVAVGLGMTWQAFRGPFLSIVKQLFIVLLAMMAGKITGRLLKLQTSVNKLGRFAGESFTRIDQKRQRQEGFKTCAILYCLAPLAILGPIQEGLLANSKALVVKGVMDGLATMGFVAVFGPGVFLAVIPMIASQGSITLLASALAPFLHQRGLIDSVAATLGLLIFCVALIIFELKKIQITDYLPSLIYAPLFTWWLR